MFRTLKKTLLLVLALILVVSSVPLNVHAEGEIDTNHEVSLTIHYLHENIPLDGVEFQLYHVADILSSGEYALTEDFQGYPISLENMDSAAWRAMTKTLLYFIQADNLSPLDCAETNEEGIIAFPTENMVLFPGLYLVTADPKVTDTHTIYGEPFLISLPGEDIENNGWQYDIAVHAKNTPEENPDTPEDDVTERRVLKVWSGDAEQVRPEEIIIQLIKNGEVYDTVTLSADNNWRYVWNSLPQYNDQGVKNQWGVIEKTIEDYRVSVTIEGTTFVVTNSYDPGSGTADTVRRVVHKIWDDKGYETKRPDSIKVSILCNGEVHDTQILSDGNSWKYAWENLPARDDDGKEIIWTIREENIDGYIADVVEKGDNFILTNTVKKPSLPQTGMLWWPVPVLAAAGLLFLIMGGFLGGRKEDA